MAHEISSPVGSVPGNPSRPSIGNPESSLMIDVTKQNFLQVGFLVSLVYYCKQFNKGFLILQVCLYAFQQSNDFLQRLPKASWIAIDEEMSGIQLPSSMATKLHKDDSPSQRYPSLKLVSERYAIIQLGVTLFEQVPTTTSEDGPHKFHVVRYKFTLFPASEAREVVLSPGSLRFLAEENNWYEPSSSPLHEDLAGNPMAGIHHRLI